MLPGATVETASRQVALEVADPPQVLRRAMAISGLRCSLTYLVFPFLLPLAGISSGIGSSLGLILGPIAIAANGYSLNRFWRADHRFRVGATVLHVAMVLALSVVLAGDVRSVLLS